jgi:RNA polymerase sigma-70 factor (ECF subfamily)
VSSTSSTDSTGTSSPDARPTGRIDGSRNRGFPLGVAGASKTLPADIASERGEKELVERLRAGDEAAFEAMVRAYGPRMLAVAKRYLPMDADAEDALQDAFLNAFRAISRFEGDSRLTTWLHRVVVNAALMRIRSRTRRPETALEDVTGGQEGDALPPRAPWTLSAPQILERSELRDEVRRGLERLPEVYRIPVRMRDIEGLDVDLICATLGVGLSTLKSRLRRGRLALREVLDARFGVS